ncbi:MAG TPA: M14 family zinc carboxypeptidase [Vicinamibacterales bacterium]|nr:M14 family zinc carboxypeptidase [Vicinamibacterales bacterium]
MLRTFGTAAIVVLSVLTTAAQRATPISPQDLAAIWDAERVSPPVPPLLDHADVERRLTALARSDPRFILERAGSSLEGRSINLVTVGTGPYRVLLWSQMHGDEPTATAALFDVFEYFQRHRTDPAVRRILSSLTLYVVPMLNPDGAERFQRRNAQGIDINRDALGLQTPEGRVLKAVRDRFNPKVGFNLHNQGWGTSVGDPPKPASISLLSVAYDKPRSENAGRRLTKKLCAVIRDALEPFASGQIGRYDDEFEVRAFGDNLTLWGTPVVLIETGPFPSAEPDPPLVRMNFVAILSALDALATGSVERANPKRYEELPFNESRMFYVLVRQATVVAGSGVPPFTADIGIAANRRVRPVDGQRRIQVQANIGDLGDLRTYGALRTIDARGLVAAPLWDPEMTEGQEVDLPDFSKAPSPRIIVPGQSAEIVLLRSLNDPSKPASRYVVDTILKY